MAITNFFVSIDTGGGSITNGWGACGGLSAILGRADGESPDYEAQNVGAQCKVSTFPSTIEGLKFSTSVNGAAAWLGRCLQDGGVWIGDATGKSVWIFSFQIQMPVASLTSPFKIISRTASKNQAVLTISSDRKLHCFNAVGTEIMTASTPFVSTTGLRRGALVIDAYSADHGGYYLFWLLAETSAGVYTEVASYATLTMPWAAADGDWFWGEILAGGTNLFVDVYMANLITLSDMLAGRTHAANAPHLVAAPIPGIYGGIADANGATQEWVHSHTPNYGNWNDGDDAKINSTNANPKKELSGAAAVANLNASNDIINNPMFRLRSQATAGKGITWNGGTVIELAGSSSGLQPLDQQPPAAHGHQASRYLTAGKPGGGNWVPGDAINVEYGGITTTSHNSNWEVEAVGIYWAQKDAAMPLLSAPPPRVSFAISPPSRRIAHLIGR